MPGSQLQFVRTPVSIVMCTYQGARHVEDQLQTLLEQSWPVSITVSDDASTDDTLLRIRPMLRAGRDNVIENPANLGYVGNFEQALQHVVARGDRYIALSDQDDLWRPDRIANGMREMQRLERHYGPDTPLLVHSDLQLVDEDGEPLDDSFLRYRRYRIQSGKRLCVVLGENGVMGNTVLMNQALARLALPFPEALHVHDYWLALLAELFGQRGMLDEPQVRYRLHQHNASNTASSMQSGWRARARQWRACRLLSRNLKLPFKEDSRLAVIRHLLQAQARFPALDAGQRAELSAFTRYLSFEQPRLVSLYYLLYSGVARKGGWYRLRLCLATLLTQRYSSSRKT